MATDNIERFPGQKPGSICRRHEQRIDGSRLSPGQRAAYGFIQGGSAAGRWGTRKDRVPRARDVARTVRCVRVRTLGRREFITVLGGAAAWPLAGQAQQPAGIRRVGVLLLWRERRPAGSGKCNGLCAGISALRVGRGKNIRIDYRFAAGDPALFKTYAAELVGLTPDVILAGASAAVAELRQRTCTIPIVFVLLVDPVGQGLVESLARPVATSRGSASSTRR